MKLRQAAILYFCSSSVLRQISSNGPRPLPPECHGLVDQISWFAYRQRVLAALTERENVASLWLKHACWNDCFLFFKVVWQCSNHSQFQHSYVTHDIPAIPYSLVVWGPCPCDVTVCDSLALDLRPLRSSTSFENSVGTAFGFSFLHPSCRCASNWLESKCISQSLLEGFGCQPLPARPHRSSHNRARSGADGQRNRRAPSLCLFLQAIAEQEGILMT